MKAELIEDWHQMRLAMGVAPAPAPRSMTTKSKPPRPRCTGVLKDGSSCRSVAIEGDYCAYHAQVVAATFPPAPEADASPSPEVDARAASGNAPRVTPGGVRADLRGLAEASSEVIQGFFESALNADKSVYGDCPGFALALADLDHFKQLNDRYGHEAGDRALRFFAQVAGQELRDDAIVARWGGEEFMIVLPNLDRHRAIAVLERIRAGFEHGTNGGHPQFTASFGLTDSTRAETLEHLIRLADLGLYEAKQAGRDRITISESMPDAPSLAPVAEPSAKPAAETHRRPALHDAAIEEDPEPRGLEIR